MNVRGSRPLLLGLAALAGASILQSAPGQTRPDATPLQSQGTAQSPIDQGPNQAPGAYEDDEHEHEGDHEHDDGWWHQFQDWLIGLLGGVHPHGDDHDGHAHHEREPTVITHFTDQTELFVEYPPLVAGESTELLVHLTHLADFKPVTEGTVSVTLSGGPIPEDRFESPEPARPGLYRVQVTPMASGTRRLRIALEAPGLEAVHDLGERPVYPDDEAAEAAQPAPKQGNLEGVVFLKEQQWRSDFATAPVERRRLRGSVPATGTLRATANGEAHVTAPSAGHLTAGAPGFPYTGMAVEQGQILAYIAPLLGGEADVAGLELDLKRAEYNLDLAREQRRRLEGLLEKGAVARRRVLEARNAEAIASAEQQAAQRRLAQLTRGPGAAGTGVAVRAPISGMIAYVTVAPGGYVAQGDRLFHVLNPERLWLDARLAEADLGGIRQPAGAWFTAEGFDRPFEITPGEDARLVAFGGMVDPVSRTVPTVFEFANPEGRLRVGLFVNARVYTGEEQQGLAIPAGALVNDAGAEVVYVQLGGERFERRVVRTGLRDGEYVIVTEGLSPHERVVSRGAYLLHLAAGAPAEAGHGHAH